MTYLSEFGAFAGTGSRNERGQTLEEFLEAYDPKKYDCPCNTVDIAVFRRTGSEMASSLQLLMIRRRNHPCIGCWALPGGFVDLRENLEDAAARELQEETGVSGISLKQNGAWGNYDRDPRWRVITTLYFTILDHDVHVQAGDDAADARWFDVSYEETAENDHSARLHLLLTDPASSLKLEAEALCKTSGEGALRQSKLALLGSTPIANDHSLMIMDTIRYIRQFE